VTESPDRAAEPRLRAVAFYLPQFHPVPENDAWWGGGFTEWTNVARARPRFPGHYQPHLPTEVGFYDLRVPEVRELQAALARTYGIEAFCYYHYWFKGRGVIDRVFKEVLRTGRPDFPFCLCWANENWTRQWDAGNGEILIEQQFDEADDREHIRWLIEAFRDPRYIRVSGRPLLMIYRVQSLPDPQRTFGMWRSECVAAGLPEPLIVKFETHGNFDDPVDYGCDQAAQFPPHGVGERVGQSTAPGCHPGNLVFDYHDVVDAFLREPAPPWKRIPTVFPSWDNSPRRKDGESLVFVNNSASAFERWLRGAAEQARAQDDEPPLVFVNAWNEWAEGAHLEPDERHGRAFLEAIARVVLGAEPVDAAGAVRPPGGRSPALPTFADLYLDLYADYRELQRSATDLMSSMERRIELAIAEREEQLRKAREESALLALWGRRLEAELEAARKQLIDGAHELSRLSQ
jgi:hypothetical protein